MSFCNLCFAVACNCGMTYLRLKMISPSSSAPLLLAFIFQHICSAFVRRCEKKLLICFSSYIWGCVLSVVWKRSQKDQMFRFCHRRILCWLLSAWIKLKTSEIVVVTQCLQYFPWVYWWDCLSLSFVFVVFVQSSAMCCQQSLSCNVLLLCGLL